jgi:predicted extracellular nuclease
MPAIIASSGEMTVYRKTMLTALLLFLLLLAACDEDDPTPEAVDQPESTETTTGVPSAGDPDTSEAIYEIQNEGVFISEVLPGVPGNNNKEFIEIYNAGSSVVDLEGWSLWYSLGTGQEEIEVYSWGNSSSIPPLGHFLLIRSEKDFGIIPDGSFDTSLFERKGGLALRDGGGNPVDQVGWGDAADGFFAGSPAAAPDDGASLERLPGGVEGSGVDSGDNAADFIARELPDPQNSGSTPTPGLEKQLTVYIEAPNTVEPGEEFLYLVHVENHSGENAAGVSVTIPVPGGYNVLDLPNEAREVGSRVEWMVGDLADGESSSANILLQSPFTYYDSLVSGYYVDAEGLLPAYGPLQVISVAGGSIPVANARELAGNVVTVEGLATMFTGGFFAGSTSTKFYMEDDTGGIQVFIPSGLGSVNVEIGDRVRVTGRIVPYRDSLELVPVEVPADVEILEPGAAEPIPSAITIADNERNDAVLGMLNVVEGTATQIEEFTYDFQIELTDDQGESTLVLIEKDTGVTAEPMDAGLQYRITGISEFYSGARQIKPRLQSDLVQIFPPVLLLEMSAGNSVLPGEILTYTVTAYNHRPDALNDLHVTVLPPEKGLTVEEILDGGFSLDEDLIWIIDTLEGNGGSVQVRYTATINGEEGDTISAEPAIAAASGQLPESVESDPYLTFIGSGVPIWAIQGSGERSPYARSEASTVGVVTGVFPELSGFWIQEIETDEEPETSSGLFVLVEEFEIPVASGDLVRVNGLVREISSQTTLHVLAPQDIEIIESGNDLPVPVDYDPPKDMEEALEYKETLEGMLVTIDVAAVVIGPTTRYGEYVLLRESWGEDSVRRTEDMGHFIFVDDGSEATHENQSTLTYTPVARGDMITGITGPLAYTFGQHKIQPISTTEIVTQERPIPNMPATQADEFSVATFNVENLFDLLPPHPSDPPMATVDEYHLKLSKIAEAIVAMGAPTIIGLQEVENIGVLEDLVEQEQIAIFDYVPILIEADDPRGIDVGYIVRSDRATVEGFENYPAPDGLTSRHTLVITTTVHLNQGDETVYVLNNHLSSLASGEEATEPRRTGQAAWNATLVERIRQNDPVGHIIVMGDFNSFIHTPPLDVLEDADLRHVYDFFGSEDEWPYTYVFQGATQSLDHILVSEGLFSRLMLVDALHIDADFPIMNLEDSSARHVSDHDPLVAFFSFAQSSE